MMKLSTEYFESFSLNNNTVLLTGATGGIGATTAAWLATAGAFVVLHYRSDEQKAQALLAEIRLQGGEGVCLQADLSSENSVIEMFSILKKAGQLPNMLVNMAAKQDVQEFESMSLEQWRELMVVNQDAAFLLMREFCKNAMNTTDNAIVNVASIEGLDPAQDHAHYSASKAALLMLTRAVAVEMSSKQIRVNAVSPGLIDRPNLKQDWPDGYSRWLSKCPLASVGEAEDVAKAICFLLSPAAKWINGTNLVIDGGLSAQARW